MNESRQQLRNRLELLEDIRCWLLDRIDGSEETKGDDGLISDFIRKLDALSSEMGTIPSAPAAATPITDAIVRVMQAGWLSLGSSAPGAIRPLVELLEVFERENADLKQRLLPQFQGRTQRAEHERDAMLEQLIAARSATAAPVAWMYEESGERMFGHPDGYRPLGAVPLYAGSLPVEERRTPWIKVEDRLPGDEDSSGGRVLCYAPHNDLMYALEPEELRDQVNFAKSACIWKYWQRMPCAPGMKGEPDRPDWAQQLPGAEIFDRAARYEYIRTLNPRKFAALYNEALMGVHQLDDLVDRYRDASRPSPTTKEQP